MGKVSQKSANYLIRAKLSSNGVIEKSDVIGAIFGQTEGLLGEDLDLRELRNKGKVGRIEVDIEENSGSTEGMIEIASSLDAVDTSILAASLETIDKVGPTLADITIEGVVDVRSSKRDYILKRSKQILKDIRSESPNMSELKEEVKHEVREGELVDYEGFKAGPDIFFSDEVLLVEGVADVRNLLKYGVKNALALGGTSVPEKLPKVVSDKEEVNAFLDGDRGGDLIFEELRSSIDIDGVARAPKDKEVEELSEKKVHEALRDMRDADYVEDVDEESNEPEEDESRVFNEVLSDLVATRAVNALNEDLDIVGKAPIDNLDAMDLDSAYALVADGKVKERLVDLAEDFGSEFVIGRDKSGTVNSSEVKILTKDELKARA